MLSEAPATNSPVRRLQDGVARAVVVRTRVTSVPGSDGACDAEITVDRSASSSFCGANVTCTPMGGVFRYACASSALNITMCVRLLPACPV